MPNVDLGAAASPAARAEFFARDVGGLVNQPGGAVVPPGPPPGPAPGSVGVPVNAPPPGPGAQAQPNVGFGGESGDPAQGAPRYAMVGNDGSTPGAALVLVGLAVLGGCTLLFAWGLSEGQRAGPGPGHARARPAQAPAT